MALLRWREVAAAIRALQDELAGGPRAELPPELELLGALVHAREERAKTKEEPERELLAGIPDAAAIFGRDGRARAANAAFERLAPAWRAVGLTPLEVVRAPELAEAVKRAIEGNGRRLEVELPGGELLDARVSPLLRGEVLVLLRDVTDARRAEAIRRDFVANASHELRTPIAAVRAAAETLLGPALDDPATARRFVEVVARHADRLARLTSDLLDLSRIESGQWAMQLGRVELRPLLDAVVELHAERAAEKGVALSAEARSELAARADPRALEQVLVNLVDNAVKYTPRGGRVELAATADAGAERGSVSISVRDTGPGIERRHLARVFERFYRADPGRSREQGGTGLGLAIAKHLVQAQGGEIAVESGAGGTRFLVRLAGA